MSDSVAMGLPLMFLQDSMANQQDYVELGLNCAEICTALGRGMNGKRLNDLNPSVCDAISQLTRCVEVGVPQFGLLTDFIQERVNQLPASALCMFGLIGIGAPAPHTAAAPPRNSVVTRGWSFPQWHSPQDL